jgi:chromosome segregation ATPase
MCYSVNIRVRSLTYLHCYTQLLQDLQAAKRKHEADAIQWHDNFEELRQHYTALEASHEQLELQLASLQSAATTAEQTAAQTAVIDSAASTAD